MLRVYGVDEHGLFRLIAPVNLWEVIATQAFVLGIAFGISFGIFDLILDKKVFRTLPYVTVILIRTIGHVLITLIILVISVLSTHVLLGDKLDSSAIDFLTHSLFTKTAFVILLYTGIGSIFFNLIRQINGMFGPGILYNIITGKYHQPKEEERIFMFLDLRSSTTYAERLGHILYSELIQDCFFDLTETIKKHEVEIYQYVGDEAVLTWKVSEGLKNLNCLRAYFSFEDTIQRRANYYFNKYDLVPAFKAGVNIGMVMVAEVGVIKKEIAYHSDVLNTAARIQGRCNEFGKVLLISEALNDRLIEQSEFIIENVGTVSLKGKEEKITMYSVDKKDATEHLYEFSE